MVHTKTNMVIMVNLIILIKTPVAVQDSPAKYKNHSCNEEFGINLSPVSEIWGIKIDKR